MKRVRVAPGKFVTISTELAEKAVRVFATGLTRNQVRDLKASEPRCATGLMVGSAKPLALTRPKTPVATAVGKISSTAPGFPRRKTADAPCSMHDADDVGESRTVETVVVALVPEFRQVRVRDALGHEYALSRRTEGVDLATLQEGQKITCTVTTTLPRVLKANVAR